MEEKLLPVWFSINRVCCYVVVNCLVEDREDKTRRECLEAIEG